MTRRTLLLFALLVFTAPLLAAATYTIASGDVVVTCPLTVGGDFQAKTKTISGTLHSGSPFTGSLVVDLRTLETGIGVRDAHLKDYLEVQKFPTATMTQITVDALEGKTAFHAVLGVHGVRRQVEGTATIQPSAGGVKVQAKFPFSISDFKIAKPTYLTVGVTNVIQIAVSFTAATK